MDPTFGKFVTLVRMQSRWLDTHHECMEWCEKNVERGGWDYYVDSNIYVFDRPEDAVAFKLTFYE